MTKPVTVGMVSMLRLLPSGRAYTGASGNQIDSDVPPDTSLYRIGEVPSCARPVENHNRQAGNQNRE